jgi:predicted metalloendopeptidase
MLDEASKKPLPPEGSATRKVIEYYQRGMDEANIRHWQLKPSRRSSADRRAAGPRADGEMIGELHTRGIFPGFTSRSRTTARTPRATSAEVARAGLGLPDRDYYFLDDERSKQIREAYRAHLEGAAAERRRRRDRAANAAPSRHRDRARARLDDRGGAARPARRPTTR